ncbi:hypothetical protein J2T20_001425 [Paenibacillus wynnii]|nr:hypothetical protein [Paenibacillus wynnii]
MRYQKCNSEILYVGRVIKLAPIQHRHFHPSGDDSLLDDIVQISKLGSLVENETDKIIFSHMLTLPGKKHGKWSLSNRSMQLVKLLLLSPKR